MEQKIGIPGAIVLAGLLIAGAVIYSNGGPREAVLPANNTPSEVTLGSAFYESQAQKLGLNIDEFKTCIAGDEALAEVRTDFEEARALIGDRIGTPATVFVAPNGTVKLLSGVQSVATIETILTNIRSGNTADFITPPETFRTSIENDYVTGNPNGEIIMIEYSDYQCPFCARYHPTLKEIVAKHSDVAWAYRHLPLSSIHPEATPAAVASECIAKQKGNDAFWEFTEAVFAI